MTNYTNLCVSYSYFKVMLLGSNSLRYIHIFIQMYLYYPQAEMVPIPGKNLPLIAHWGFQFGVSGRDTLPSDRSEELYICCGLAIVL